MSDVQSDRTDLNVSRRLRRMLKASGLPQTGKAHHLRMRFVQMTHASLILQGLCTYGRIVIAMRELLEGWADTEEGHCDVGGYQHRLLNAIDDVCADIERLAWGEWPENP
jgi:hypothetical protein